MNPMKVKEVPITLDKERKLRFDMNAFAEVEEIFGSIAEAFSLLQNGSLKATRALLWAGLIHQDEGLKEKEVGAMVSVQGLETVSEAIAQAISGSLPEPSETEKSEKKQKNPANGTGSDTTT